MNKNYAPNKNLLSSITVLLFFIGSFQSYAQNTSVTALSGSSPYCNGSAVTVTYAKNGAFIAGNVFTAQLSDASGSFATPTNIGSVTTTTAGNISATIPYAIASGNSYKIRVISSSPTSTLTTDNGTNLTINAPTISAPTIVVSGGVSYSDSCQGEIFTMSFTKTCNFAAGNVFTAQLSDASGSFASPTAIGTLPGTASGNITCTIPFSTPAGNGYRVRVVSSSPVITGPDNGTNMPIFASSAPAGGVGTPGNGYWNVYCYNGVNNFNNSYLGYYTENNLNINTALRHGNSASPSTANALSGNAYVGCPFSQYKYSVSYIRTGIPCGYYEIDIPSHDDNVYLLINGTPITLNYSGCCGAVTNPWQGFISPTTTVEVRYSNNMGPGNLSANFITPAGGITMPTPVTVCAGTSANITAVNSYTTGFTYSWAPAADVSPSTGSLAVSITPSVTTTYTLSAIDNNTLTNTGCAVTNTITITTNPLATTTVALTYPPPVITGGYTYTPVATCYGVNTATLIAGGAYTYTWSPASGLSSTTGYSVVANPSVTTVYTVTGSNNCLPSVNAITTVTVQAQPAAPPTSTFGNGTWNAFCFYDATWTSYYGYYTENNLSFDTRTRWNQSNGPSTCTTTATGSAYSGCSFGSATWTMSFKRTGIPCGYYQIDIPGHDDNTYLYINGSLVWSHAGCCDAHINVWSGFINPSTTVEFKQYNGGGPGYLAANFTPTTYPVLNIPATICAGSSAILTASPNLPGAVYTWDDGAGGITLSPTTGTTTAASPTVSTSYTCTVSDPVTTCSASASVLITVNPSPTTSVTPIAGTTSCSINNTYTLTASGAYTYSWSPSAGLNTTTGYSVIATPSVTTIYTVSGSNNCSSVIATSTITVLPLASPTVYPSSAWNAYCYGDKTLTSYYGYYTTNGSGATGYDFNTTTQWPSASGTCIPSNATAVGGTAYVGCAMTYSNFSISFKRTGFTCGTYSINIPTHDDDVTLFVNGTQVAKHAGCCDAHTAIWVGSLNGNSTVEVQLVQGGGGSSLNVTFNRAAPPATQYTWIGGTSNDWFTAANWCGGGGSVPTSAYDVVIPAAGPQFMPVINNTGAQCKSITINPAIAAGTYNSAIPSASLTVNGTYTLDVYGSWNNGGALMANNSTINMNGATAATMSCVATQSFYNLNINNSSGITVPSGTTQVSNNMNFTTGIVNQNATLNILNGATVTGASNSSYVNGFITKYGNNAFTFPVGASNLYRPIAMSAPSLATDNFTAKYFNSNVYSVSSYTTNNWDAGIDHLSGCEYWILNRTGGVSTLSVTLSWNTNSCGVDNLDSLLVARYDAGSNAWKNHGNGGYTGNTTAGTIVTSGVVTNFSPFTLASHTTTKDPLPIELLYFTASPVNNTTDLTWATATETNNKYFTVEKSKDGVNFEFLKQINSEALNGNSTMLLNYKTYDLSPFSGINYYRLKQTDYNGSYKYSNVAQVTFNKKSFVSVFPNPATNTVFINVSADYDNASLKFMDALGREVLSQNINSSNVNTINTSSLMSGMYYVIIDNGNELNKTKITIQK